MQTPEACWCVSLYLVACQPMGSCVHVSQAATNGRDSISPYDSLEPEQEDEEEEPSPPKQVCVWRCYSCWAPRISRTTPIAGSTEMSSTVPRIVPSCTVEAHSMSCSAGYPLACQYLSCTAPAQHQHQHTPSALHHTQWLVITRPEPFTLPRGGGPPPP